MSTEGMDVTYSREDHPVIATLKSQEQQSGHFAHVNKDEVVSERFIGFANDWQDMFTRYNLGDWQSNGDIVAVLRRIDGGTRAGLQEEYKRIVENIKKIKIRDNSKGDAAIKGALMNSATRLVLAFALLAKRSGQ